MFSPGGHAVQRPMHRNVIAFLPGCAARR